MALQSFRANDTGATKDELELGALGAGGYNMQVVIEDGGFSGDEGISPQEQIAQLLEVIASRLDEEDTWPS